MGKRTSAWGGLLGAGDGLLALALCSALTLTCALAGPAAAQGFGDANRGLTQQDFHSVAAAVDGALFAGGRGVVFRTEAGGFQWRASLLVRARAEVQEEDATGMVDAFEVSWEEQVELRLEELVDELRDELTTQFGDAFFDSAVLEEFVEDEIEARLDELRDLAEAEVSEGFEELEEEDEELVEDEEVGDVRIRHLLAPADRAGVVVAATGVGLYVTDDGGRRWRRVAVGTGGMESEGVRATASLGDRMWAVGEGGLHEGRLVGARLDADSTLPAADPVFVAVCGESLVVVDDSELLERPLEGGVWRRESVGATELRHVRCGADGRVLSTGNGVWRHEGERWQRLTDAGLPSRSVRMTLVDGEGRLWAATDGGVAEYAGDRWRAEESVPVGTEVRWLALTSWGTVLAATGVGMFEVTTPEAVDVRERVLLELQSLWAAEPRFEEAVRAARENLGVDVLSREGWARQEAAFSPMLPQRVRVEWRWQEVLQERGDRVDSRPTPSVRRTNRSTENNWWEMVVRLSWDLGRPVDVTRGIQHSLNDRRLVALERRLQARMLRLWQQRRASMLALAAAADAPLQARIRLEMRVMRASAELDALTGYRFDFLGARASGQTGAQR